MKNFHIKGRSIPTEWVLLNIEDLMRILGLRRTSIATLRKQPDFPKPVQLTRGRLGWRAVDIQNWIDARAAKGSGKKDTPTAPVTGKE